jgi:hypothetical protein
MKWFTIKGGEHDGKRHVSGWMLSAIKGERIGPNSDGWLSFGTCPICHAMVLADEKHAYGDQTWAHEQWHSGTDFPDIYPTTTEE